MTFFTPPSRFAALLRCIGAALALGTTGMSQAQSLPYALDLQHTKVHWEVRHFGTSTSRGRFDDIDGQLRVDFNAGRGEVSITIGTASISTGVAPLDTILRGEYFFASASAPTAYFVSRNFHFEGRQLTQLVGELTLRDRSVPLTLTARHFACRDDARLGRPVCGGDFEGEVRRGDLGITYGLPFVADRVKLVVQVEAVGPTPPAGPLFLGQ